MSLTLYWGHPLGVDYDTLNSGDGVTTPILAAHAPTAGQTGLPKATNIVVDVTNVAGHTIDSSLTTITVDGVLQWSSDAISLPWTGSKAVIAGGFRYTLIPPTMWSYDEVISVAVSGENDQGVINTLNYNFTIMSEIPSTVSVKELFVVSQNVIMLKFTDRIAVTQDLINPAKYTVTCTSGGANGVVSEVLPVTGYYVDYLCLKVDNLLESNSYQLNIFARTLIDLGGQALTTVPLSWTLKRTKVDSVIGSLPGFYNTTVGANLRAIIEAIMISDEHIGGDF
jgi:hypothetical protein